MNCDYELVRILQNKVLGTQRNPIARQDVWREALVDGPELAGRDHTSGTGHIGKLFLSGASAGDPRLLAAGDTLLREAL